MTQPFDPPISTGKFYTEPARQLSVLAEFDVVVCGGGPAGCAAALASARRGAKTLLIEREGALGGAPVTQLVLSLLSTNGVDLQGIWHEWARALQRRGGISEPRKANWTGAEWIVANLDPEMVKYAWDELLADAGVSLLHLAQVAGAIVEDGAICGVLVETKAGRQAVLAKRVIDCTGDADVCAVAGVSWEQGIGGAPWAMAVSLNAWYGGTAARIHSGLLRVLFVNPLNPWSLTRALREGRQRVWERFQQQRAEPDGEQLFLAQTANLPGVRASRRVKGITTATADDAWTLNKYPDGIARVSWEIDIHPADRAEGKAIAYGGDAYQPRRQRVIAGDYFDLRYGCLVPETVDNLLVAGRCVSADAEAQACLRIQQTCLATGQAAGTAAALSLQHGVTPRALDPMLVVKRLDEDRAAVEPAFAML